MAVLTPEGWTDFLVRHPDTHILQTSAWGELKSSFGWRAAHLAQENCGAQVLFRKLPLGFTVAYIPKGPVGVPEHWSQLWRELDDLCRSRRAIHLIVEPDLWVSHNGEAGSLIPQGFQAGTQTIQPPRTIVIKLEGEETDILGRMKQKTRYNIQLAKKRGVRVYPSQEVKLFHQLALETGARDGFGVHSLEYYKRMMELFHPGGACELLVADYNGEPVAGLMVFQNGFRSWYFYGASSGKYREHMPTYLLQWEAICWARSQGCREYDLWGVPDADEAELEAGFTGRSDGLWGVYRFKRGFGGSLRRSVGPWDRIYQPAFYRLYRWWVRRGSAQELAGG